MSCFICESHRSRIAVIAQYVSLGFCDDCAEWLQRQNDKVLFDYNKTAMVSKNAVSRAIHLDSEQYVASETESSCDLHHELIPKIFERLDELKKCWWEESDNGGSNAE